MAVGHGKGVQGVMERIVIKSRRNNGNGLTRCDMCDNLTWDNMTTTYYNKAANTSFTICSECERKMLKRWLIHGYLVKEEKTNG